MRYEAMTPVQAEVIPLAIAGNDVIAASQTGTGKTAAFLIPLLQRLIDEERTKTHALVLTPTRELAIQIDETFAGLGYHCGMGSVCVVGGMPFAPQEEALVAKTDAVIATPGRLLDHMRFGNFDFSSISYLVLDEADSFEFNVRLISAKIELGMADAGMVYRTEVQASDGAIVEVPLPLAAVVVAPYPIAVMSNSKAPAIARQFVDFVVSPAGQKTLASHGYEGAE